MRKKLVGLFGFLLVLFAIVWWILAFIQHQTIEGELRDGLGRILKPAPVS